MKNEIIPSAPFESYEEIQMLAVKAKGRVGKVQVDICDGKYVKNVSWPFTEYSLHGFQDLSQEKELDVFMPEWEELDYSADLMVQTPEKYIESLVSFGFSEMIFHFNSLGENATEKFTEIKNLCESFDVKIFIAIDIKTDVNLFLEFLKLNVQNISGVQIMGIENIGIQGQDFDERSLEIVAKIKNFLEDGNLDLDILFDGAINENTIEDIKNSGVNVFCVGSFLTKASDFSYNLRFIKKVLEL